MNATHLTTSKWRRPGRALATLIGAILALSLALPAIAGVDSATFWVDDDGMAGPGACNDTAIAATSVQAAIDASNLGDTVLVCPGTYVGALTIGGEAHHGLTLRSVRHGAATLVSPSDDSFALIEVDSDWVRIQGFRLVQPTAAPCSGVTSMIDSSAIGTEILDNVIRATGTDTYGDCGYDFGISVNGDGGILIRGNVVRDFMLAGILVDEAGARVINNSIRYYHVTESPTFVAGAGIWIVGAFFAEVRRNDIVGLESAGASTPRLGVGFLGQTVPPDELFVEANVIRRARVGLRLDVVKGAWITDNDSRNNSRRDCVDVSTGGTGTDGTDNFWIDNIGNPAKSNPSGICSLPTP